MRIELGRSAESRVCGEEQKIDPVKWVLFLQRALRIVYPHQRARQCLLVTGSSGGDPAGSTSR